MGKIVVIGSSNTDMVVRSPKIPFPGETILGREFNVIASGKAANQAVAAARAGAEVSFIANGKNIEEAMLMANKAAAISVTRMGAQPSIPAIGELIEL